MNDHPLPAQEAEDVRTARHGETTSVRPALPRVVKSEALFGGATQVAIEHDRAIYFLRQTRSGKLILTK